MMQVHRLTGKQQQDLNTIAMWLGLQPHILLRKILDGSLDYFMEMRCDPNSTLDEARYTLGLTKVDPYEEKIKKIFPDL